MKRHRKFSRWFIHQHGVEYSRLFRIVLSLPHRLGFSIFSPSLSLSHHNPQLIIQPSTREKSHSSTLASSSSYTPGFKIRKMFSFISRCSSFENCCQLMQKILLMEMRLMFEHSSRFQWCVCYYTINCAWHSVKMTRRISPEKKYFPHPSPNVNGRVFYF